MKEKRTQKKSDAVTAPDFQKTNYLKTNLLKQISYEKQFISYNASSIEKPPTAFSVTKIAGSF